MTGSVVAGLAVSAHNNATSTTATFQGVSVNTTLALPAGFTDADINSPGIAGSALYDGTGFIVSGGGADVWGTTDQFNYASESISGNATLIGRVGGQVNTNANAKAGLMIRASSAANSPQATVNVSGV